MGHVAVSFCFLGSLASVAACGGDSGSKQAKSPSAPTADAGASAQAATPAPAATTPAAAPPPADTSASAAAPDQRADISPAAKASYDRGWASWKSGDLQGAKSSFMTATQQDPHSPAPHYALGAVLERLGDVPDAQQEYRAAFTFKPDYDVAMGAYALSLAYSGHAGEADTFLSDKHTREPNSSSVAAYLSMVKSIEGDSGTAQQLAQDALKLDPNDKNAMLALARDYYRTNRDDLALYALRAILDGVNDATPPRDKDNAEGHLLRGLIYKKEGHRAAAMADFQAATAKRPDLVEATIQLGVMKLEAGNAAEATPLLESAVKFAPTSPTAHVNLGDSYRLLGRTADAKREIDTALQLDSTLAVGHYDLGLLYLFSPSVPGFQPLDQVAQAIRELETFKTMRGKQAPGQTDDSDDLLSRAKAKQAELKMPAAAPAPPPAAKPAAAAASAAPPASSAKPAASAAAPAPSAAPSAKPMVAPAPASSAKPGTTKPGGNK
jgi:Tfp pilus assembly protein PilF